MIKSITIITAQGTDGFSVGRNGITAIKQEIKQVSSDKRITVFRAYENNFIVREVSAICPLDITFGK
ncbi:hypothetical protein SDC9_62120 [bioreactor metagenome]|uniref:Uncharacterized protein n=1 Tax=bioreactor metagenome TaxID=1076179 RepID=A0A644XIX0_9ZZZZ